MKISKEKPQRPVSKNTTPAASGDAGDLCAPTTRGALNRMQAVVDKSSRMAVQRRHLQHGLGHPIQQKNNQTGMPDEIKQHMEDHFSTDFSSVKVHGESSQTGDVGALAYTQGNDIYFAPGQYRPDTGQGQQLLGHELAHVVQQRQGRVTPTGEIGGMPLNDDPKLENEADVMGQSAAHASSRKRRIDSQ